MSKKIYGKLPIENEAADLAPSIFINRAVDEINKTIEWMKSSKEAAQPLLVFIEILLMFPAKFPSEKGYIRRKITVPEWKAVFDEWYERVNKKIPEEYRAVTRTTADELFAQLEKL
ncbi:hypothetical protein [Chitinophaga sp. 212800010-3]|uniref:hypothetical protein n=1 Tax=unclassified Chitinophaga TaxID=2619133 RepID=UPI002DF22ABD|nr:hypothetical protein [Chitinophaga sp. 212800010-3]